MMVTPVAMVGLKKGSLVYPPSTTTHNVFPAFFTSGAIHFTRQAANSSLVRNCQPRSRLLTQVHSRTGNGEPDLLAGSHQPAFCILGGFAASTGQKVSPWYYAYADGSGASETRKEQADVDGIMMLAFR